VKRGMTIKRFFFCYYFHDAEASGHF